MAVRIGRFYSAGAATFGTAGKGPSTVVVHNRATGAFIKRIDTVGENLAFEHANSSIAFDGQGRDGIAFGEQGDLFAGWPRRPSPA